MKSMPAAVLAASLFVLSGCGVLLPRLLAGGAAPLSDGPQPWQAPVEPDTVATEAGDWQAPVDPVETVPDSLLRYPVLQDPRPPEPRSAPWQAPVEPDDVLMLYSEPDTTR